MTHAVTSAGMLEGMTLADGVHVVKKIDRGPNPTGSNFSVGYEVQLSDGRPGFLKAIDFSHAMRQPDPARFLQPLIEAFNFERDILQKCRDHRLDYVVHAIGEGKLQVPNIADGGVVQYLLFERADRDVRHQTQLSQQFDVAFGLRASHHIAVALSQLHSRDIAHQDVKPSNVLVFGKKSKLGDLGRAAQRNGATPPHEDLTIPGDPRYMPPEQAYGHTDADWHRRRLGSDLYHLGSMVRFLFTGVGTTESLFVELDSSFYPGRWNGSYADVLPYVRDAFGRALVGLAAVVPSPFRSDVVTAVRQLCDPDPVLRGHPLNRRRSETQYGLERFVSLFNRLASQAESGLSKYKVE